MTAMLVSVRDSCVRKLGEQAWSQFEAKANILFLPDAADARVDFASISATSPTGYQSALRAPPPHPFQQLSNAQQLKTALDVSHTRNLTTVDRG